MLVIGMFVNHRISIGVSMRPARCVYGIASRNYGGKTKEIIIIMALPVEKCPFARNAIPSLMESSVSSFNHLKLHDNVMPRGLRGPLNWSPLCR